MLWPSPSLLHGGRHEEFVSTNPWCPSAFCCVMFRSLSLFVLLLCFLPPVVTFFGYLASSAECFPQHHLFFAGGRLENGRTLADYRTLAEYPEGCFASASCDADLCQDSSSSPSTPSRTSRPTARTRAGPTVLGLRFRDHQAERCDHRCQQDHHLEWAFLRSRASRLVPRRCMKNIVAATACKVYKTKDKVSTCPLVRFCLILPSCLILVSPLPCRAARSFS